MEIKVKKLSPELENDYIEFFDNKAFVDDSEFTGCYCTCYMNVKLRRSKD